MFRRMGAARPAVLTALLAAGSLSYAVAQEGDDSTLDVIKLEPISAQSDEPTLSPAAQARAAEAAVQSASASCDAQSQAHQRAKRDSDIIRATCLQDKLDQCNANLQSMKRRQSALSEAISKGDAGSSNHEYTVIGVLSQKLKMLSQAANQCVGQDLFETGDTRVKEEVDLFAPDENPTTIDSVPDWPIPFIPPPVSGVT